MLQVRPSDERGRGNLDWLDTRFTFSFDQYYDPDHMGFGFLRVLNEDWIEPGGGFPMHPHRNMEIVTYLIEGALEHKDSMGNGGIIRAGEVQRMSAGKGIMHSEFNPSSEEKAHLLQIWMHPRENGIEPGYEQRFIGRDGEGTRLVASPDGRDGSATIQQDVDLYAGILGSGKEWAHELVADNAAWIQVVGGAVEVNGVRLGAGDGAGIGQEPRLTIQAAEKAEVLLFDMATGKLG
ncbi:MAG: pirin family protein [bacterium]|nr:pirin family protein [bacterium]